jgi:hypothetical protein
MSAWGCYRLVDFGWNIEPIWDESVGQSLVVINQTLVVELKISRGMALQNLRRS